MSGKSQKETETPSILLIYEALGQRERVYVISPCLLPTYRGDFYMSLCMTPLECV